MTKDFRLRTSEFDVKEEEEEEVEEEATAGDEGVETAAVAHNTPHTNSSRTPEEYSGDIPCPLCPNVTLSGKTFMLVIACWFRFFLSRPPPEPSSSCSSSSRRSKNYNTED